MPFGTAAAGRDAGAGAGPASAKIAIVTPARPATLSTVRTFCTVAPVRTPATFAAVRVRTARIETARPAAAEIAITPEVITVKIAHPQRNPGSLPYARAMYV